MASCATLDLLPRLPQSYICVVGMILKTDGIGRGSRSRPNGVVIDHDACALDNDSNLCYVQVPQLILTKHLRIRASGVSVSWVEVWIVQVCSPFNQRWMGSQKSDTNNDVPQLEAGFPMIILSETPDMPSIFPTADASKRWSVVFSNDASISTLSFILATPNLVIPSTSP